MISKWIYKYNSDIIVVAGGRRGERALFVNGKLQDKKLSLSVNTLQGRLSEGEKVEANINGWFFKIKCTLFVDGIALKPVKLDKKKTVDWIFIHNSNTIVVINGMFKAELYINGEFQDETGNLTPDCSPTLYGQFDNGDELKVKIYGAVSGEICLIYINNRFRKLEEIDETELKE